MLLTTRQVEKVWGCDSLPAPFVAPAGQRIGEVWFVPPPELPQLLCKYIFTSEKLSVQVHPSDAQTEVAGLGRQGKEECWLVIAAEPGAKLGVGFEGAVDAETMRAAALDGSIEHMLRWHEVEAGDFFYIPANTVHAIGGGVSIVEIQQNSDITYRLYDYGRPRDLHMDQAIGVASGTVIDPRHVSRLPDSGHAALVDGPYFHLDWIDGLPEEAQLYSYAGKALILPIKEEVLLADGTIINPGECGLVDNLASASFAPNGKALVTAPA